jgi:hypothetical protein
MFPSAPVLQHFAVNDVFQIVTYIAVKNRYDGIPPENNPVDYGRDYVNTVILIYMHKFVPDDFIQFFGRMQLGIDVNPFCERERFHGHIDIHYAVGFVAAMTVNAQSPQTKTLNYKTNNHHSHSGNEYGSQNICE